VLCLPFYDALREAVRGNEKEAHLSVWSPSDFRRKATVVREFPSVRETKAGVVVMAMTPEASWIARAAASPFRRWISAVRSRLW